jgi:hypothetical protein
MLYTKRRHQPRTSGTEQLGLATAFGLRGFPVAGSPTYSSMCHTSTRRRSIPGSAAEAADHQNDGATGNVWDFPMGSSAVPGTPS